MIASAGVFATALVGCAPGYMKASDLASKHQGPADCEARCVELGMHMGALVLVSDTMPGCVCQPNPPKPPPGEAPKPATPSEPPKSEAAPQGASAATVGLVVAAIAAASTARAAQAQQQQEQKQQSYSPN